MRTCRHNIRPKERRGLIVEILGTLYPNPRSELNFRNEYELLIAVLLSAQCTDKKVNEVTVELFRQFPDFQALSAASLDGIETLIRPVNYYRTKARHLLALAKKVSNDFHGSVPRSHSELTSLPGVGNKTANVVLSELGIAPTFPVDTHVFRVSRRLGIARGKTVEAVEAALKRNFSPSLWRNLHHWLIFHGRRVCAAQRPHCSACALKNYCPAAREKAPA